METQSFTFPSFIRAEFEKKLVSLNKKLAKIADANAVNILTEQHFNVRIPVPANVVSTVEHLDVDHTTVQVNLPVNITHKGYTYLGSLISDGDTILRWSVDGHTLSDLTEMKCDHCGHNRKRTTCFVLLEEKTGDIKTIGSTCVNEYLGGIKVEQALNIFFKFYNNITDMDRQGLLFSAGRSHGIHLDLFVGAAIMAHHMSPQYVKTVYNDSSINCVWDVLYGGERACTNVVLPSVAEIKDRLISKYNVSQANSDFVANVKSALFVNGELRQYLTPKGYGIASWSIWDALNNPTTQIKNTVPVAAALIGDEIVVKGKIVSSETVYTLAGSKSKIKVKTDDGRYVLFLTDKENKEGEQIEVRATVEHRDSYRGYETTWVKL